MITEPFEIEDVACELQCTAAIVLSDKGEVDPIRLQNDVDITLSEAKLQGSGASVIFSPELRNAFEGREDLRKDLKRAFAADEIEPFFQP